MENHFSPRHDAPEGLNKSFGHLLKIKLLFDYVIVIFSGWPSMRAPPVP